MLASLHSYPVSGRSCCSHGTLRYLEEKFSKLKILRPSKLHENWSKIVKFTEIEFLTNCNYYFVIDHSIINQNTLNSYAF